MLFCPNLESQLSYKIFVETDREITSMVIHTILLIQEGRAVVSYWQKYLHKVLVNHWGQSLPREKCEKVNWPAGHDLNHVDWIVKLEIKQTKCPNVTSYTRLRGLDVLGRFFIFKKGDNFCGFLFSFLHPKPFSSEKERICSEREQIFSLRVMLHRSR